MRVNHTESNVLLMSINVAIILAADEPFFSSSIISAATDLDAIQH
jgi:hypothetical protein